MRGCADGRIRAETLVTVVASAHLQTALTERSAPTQACVSTRLKLSYVELFQFCGGLVISVAMELHLLTTVFLILGSILTTHQTHSM